MIGEYPLLSVEPPAAGNVSEGVDLGVFEYESCTNLERTPGEVWIPCRTEL